MVHWSKANAPAASEKTLNYVTTGITTRQISESAKGTPLSASLRMKNCEESRQEKEAQQSVLKNNKLHRLNACASTPMVSYCTEPHPPRRKITYNLVQLYQDKATEPSIRDVKAECNKDVRTLMT